jgi:hypothetical protein
MGLDYMTFLIKKGLNYSSNVITKSHQTAFNSTFFLLYQ